MSDAEEPEAPAEEERPEETEEAPEDAAAGDSEPTGDADDDKEDEAPAGGEEEEKALKALFREMDVFDPDVVEVFEGQGVATIKDLAQVTETMWEEIYRLSYVERAANIKEAPARQRLEKKMRKIETYWRKISGVKKSAATGAEDEKERPADQSSRAELDKASEEATDLKAFMKKSEFFEANLFVELYRLECLNEDDIAAKLTTNRQFNELRRKVIVQREKDGMDAQGRSRLEKLLGKFEKYWRKKTGVKKGAGKAKGGGGDAKDEERKDVSTAALREEALRKAPKLKKYMQKSDYWNVDLFTILVTDGCTTGEEIFTVITTNKHLEDVLRRVTVQREKDGMDSQGRSRLEKLLSKFEKDWRKKTGVKKSSASKGRKSVKSPKRSAKEQAQDQRETEGKALKAWMRKNNIWEQELLDQLLQNNIKSENDLTGLRQTEFDEIVRKVRVQRRTELKDTQSKQRLDKKLVAFEKLWRKKSGIKKTSQTKNTKS